MAKNFSPKNSKNGVLNEKKLGLKFTPTTKFEKNKNRLFHISVPLSVPPVLYFGQLYRQLSDIGSRLLLPITIS
jgi:hypothetical protein